jgi:hypothetical protein
MADPLQVHYRLTRQATQYAVFEPDQVLTHGQLNSLSEFLDRQDRLSRVDLIGVGIASGLRVSRVEAGVRISRGMGITSDGDLLRLAQDTVYNSFRPYDRSAPVYPPFYPGLAGTEPGDGLGSGPSVPGDAAMLSAVELLPAGSQDVLAQPLSALPAPGLNGKVLLMLAETVVNDPDLCTGTDCDNLGRDALHRVRLLLIDSADAAALAARAAALDSARARARTLVEVPVARPLLARRLTSVSQLAASFRSAAAATLEHLLPALDALTGASADLCDELFGGNPAPQWRRRLGEQAQSLGQSAAGQQIWYAHLKDLAAAHEAARQALWDDAAVALPDPLAFPKHLLLGQLGAPLRQRTPWYPSARDAAADSPAERARFALQRLQVLVTHFALPGDTTLRITPSRGEQAPLEERAIPWYYAVDPQAPVALHEAWNQRLTQRGQASDNLGYRSDQWPGSTRAATPLGFAIAAHDFFRIEGHLGQPVEQVTTLLREQIAAHHLPFQVQPVLLHELRRWIKVRPTIRYNDLHRLHHLLRQDVSLRLDESEGFSGRLSEQVRQAVDSALIPEQTETGVSVVQATREAQSALGAFAAAARPVLKMSTYSAYRAGSEASRWQDRLGSTLGTVGSARIHLGGVARSDFVSPADSLLQTTHPTWLQWLDDLIASRDEQADDKLLLTRFLAEHPGLDHLGGVPRGGTFVPVYDDSGRVVADFCLPYPCAEVDEPEPSEPPLQMPPQRPPLRPPLELPPIKLLPPVDRLVGRLMAPKFEEVSGLLRQELAAARTDLTTNVAQLKEQVQRDLREQSAGIEGLVKGAFSVKEATGAGVVSPGKTYTTGDALLNQMLQDVDYQRQRVQSLVELTNRADLSADSRTQAQALLAKAQADLGGAVADTTTHVVTQQVDTSSGAAANVAAVLANSTVYVTDAAASAALSGQLTSLQQNANLGSSQQLLLGNLQNLNRRPG